MAVALFGELRREFLLLLFELVEFHFDQFAMFQHFIQGGEELRTEALFADLERSLEPLGLGFEIADLGIGEREHGCKLCESAPESKKNVNDTPRQTTKPNLDCLLFCLRACS